MHDPVGDLFVEFRGPTPLKAARAWVLAGAPPAAAPSPEILSAADRGPASIELSKAEIAALSKVLDAVVPMFDERVELGSALEDLLARGILIRATHGLALAPEHLWTIGVAAWADRQISAHTPAPESDERREFVRGRFSLIGDRAVEVTPHGQRNTFEVCTPDRVESSVVALITSPNGQDAPDPHDLRWVFGWPEDVLQDDRSHSFEYVHTVLRGDRVDWSTGLSDRPGGADDLSVESAVERLRAAVVRGADVDRRTSEDALLLAKRARRSRWNPITRPKYGSAALSLGLEFALAGSGARSATVHEERARQWRAQEYWRLKPSFTRRQR